MCVGQMPHVFIHIDAFRVETAKAEAESFDADEFIEAALKRSYAKN